MSVRLIEPTPSAYGYPLLIKNLLKTPRVYSPDREIIFQDKSRYDYRTLYRRISRLAHVLDRAGVKQGETVAVMEYDSHRYLESFFAIPMMGSVIHTVNIRRSPESLVHTLNHAESAVIIANV
ncbi:MAG: AMP-binding protein, partial [Thermodesulfobacteriota bacterium]